MTLHLISDLALLSVSVLWTAVCVNFRDWIWLFLTFIFSSEKIIPNSTMDFYHVKSTLIFVRSCFAFFYYYFFEFTSNGNQIKFTLTWCNAEGVAVNQSLGDLMFHCTYPHQWLLNHRRTCLNKIKSNKWEKISKTNRVYRSSKLEEGTAVIFCVM